MDYEEMSEPNMKLSRALLIVLVLHVVAVAGIIAFNAIKTRQGLPPPVSSQGGTSKVLPAPSRSTPPAADAAALRRAQGSDEAKVAKVSTKPVAKDDHKAEAAKPTENNSKKAEPAKTYVVAKGDNPVAIARKLKVPYDDLMAANHIDDPHKLQIGQKLIVPAKPAKSKKGE
jgi:LysM repeat protein